MLETQSNVPVEIEFRAHGSYDDPIHQVTLDVLFTDTEGVSRRVPAFWAGGSMWKVRYASPLPGNHNFQSECGVTTDAGLHHVRGSVAVSRYDGSNPLYRHGPIRIADDKRHFAHADGTPFFWMGDTWWMGLCHRLRWPDEFAQLTSDRIAKGFNVIQIVAGLYPDMPPFDPRGANEAGFPWEADYARIRPEYFDLADRRLRFLIEAGLTPCIVGMWGYFLPWMGVTRAIQHWRYLLARYAAWPVVWCVAGEANLPYYLTEGFPFDDREQVHGWTEVLRYVRQCDPWRRPLSIHPTGLGRLTARGATDDESLLDFDMLQTGHGRMDTLAPTVDTLRASYDAQPRMPVLNSEVNYEALMGIIPAEIVRLMFWPSVLSGAAGHTYGANGIWQCNRRDEAHGASPHGGNYGTISWEEAMRLPGSAQLGMGKRLLEAYSWVELKPCIDGATWQPAAGDPARFVPYAADLGAAARMIYVPDSRPIRVHNLRAGAPYSVMLFDPVTGARETLQQYTAGDDGEVALSAPEHGHDWIAILQSASIRT